MTNVIECVKSFFGFLTKDEIAIKEKENKKTEKKIDELTKELTFMYSTKKV